MGLDMCLYKKTYVKNWNHTPEDKRYQISVTRGGFDAGIQPDRVEYIVEGIGYWRKANAIHRWFVDNCQDGVDDCRDAYVSRNQLHDLLGLVNKVLDSSKVSETENEVVIGTSFNDGKAAPIMGKMRLLEDDTVAKELLPTQSGFFFGGTEYDEWYYENLVETKKILEDALEDPDADHFEYSSSW